MDCNSTNGVFVVFHTEIVNALWRLKVKLSLAVTDSVECKCHINMCSIIRMCRFF